MSYRLVSELINHSRRWVWQTLMFVCLLVSPLTAQAAGLADLFDSSADTQQDFLPVREAFTVVPTVRKTVEGQQLTITINITPEHYIYRDKFKLTLPDGVKASKLQFNVPSSNIDDPQFGKVAIFDQASVTATAKLTNTLNENVKDKVIISWQGCAKAGLCYPPERERVDISLPSRSDVTANTEANNTSSANTSQTDKKYQSKSTQSVITDQQAQIDNKRADNNQIDSNQKGFTSEVIDTAEQVVDKAQASSGDMTPSSKTQTPDSINNQNSIMVAQSAAETQLNMDVNDAVDNELSSDSVNAVNNIDNNVGSHSGNNANGNISDTTFKNDSKQDPNAQDPFGLMTHPWLALGFIFLAGLGLAFTPCVLPMLPIVSNIVARQHNPTVRGGLMLSGSYALGVSIAYGILGALVAIFGQSLNVIGLLQNPVILLAFAGVFAVLALYMLDVMAFRLPSAVRQRLHGVSQQGHRYLGSIWGSGLAGLLSALVVSPCVSAPLFGVLIAVSTIGNPLLGFVSLFLLGFGLSLPLMLVGATEGGIMPKAGEWMNWIKKGFALLLFAVSLLLVERVLMSPWMLGLWAVWFMVVAMWAWSWQGKGVILSRAIAGVTGVWAMCLLFGMAMGSNDSWRPLDKLVPVQNPATASFVKPTAVSNKTPQPANSLHMTSSNSVRITKISELELMLDQHPQILVDVTAEWCIECRIMDKTLFANPPKPLSSWQVVKLDITDVTPDSRQVLEIFNLFGPPALLYFVDGKLVNKQVGEVSRIEFEQALNTWSDS